MFNSDYNTYCNSAVPLINLLKNKCLMLVVCLLLSANASFADKIKYIDIHQAKQLHDQGALFIDTRTWIERKLGKIQGSVAMKKSEVIDVAQYLIPDKNKAVVTYCAVGSRASDAAANLSDLGYTNINVVANGQGYSHWKKAGYPVSP